MKSVRLVVSSSEFIHPNKQDLLFPWQLFLSQLGKDEEAWQKIKKERKGQTVPEIRYTLLFPPPSKGFRED